MATVAWSTSEYLPSEEIIKLLNTTWTNNTDGVPDKPTLIEASGTGVDNAADPVRFDLNMADVIIARPGSPAFEEQPIGNWIYGNRNWNVELEIYAQTRTVDGNSVHGKQQLYNMMREIRRMCHASRVMPTTSKFQRLQFLNFTVETQQAVNVWYGTINLQLVNMAVPLETAWSD